MWKTDTFFSSFVMKYGWRWAAYPIGSWHSTLCIFKCQLSQPPESPGRRSIPLNIRVWLDVELANAWSIHLHSSSEPNLNAETRWLVRDPHPSMVQLSLWSRISIFEGGESPNRIEFRQARANTDRLLFTQVIGNWRQVYGYWIPNGYLGANDSGTPFITTKI
jgi:hypothetical protein